MCFCACAIAALCDNDFSGINKPALLSFLASLQTYQGGFGGEPGSEAHSGYTFCAVACYSLMGELDKIPDRESLRHFLVHRQQGSGFNGRTNKAEDTCYTWWTGASLKLLDCGFITHTLSISHNPLSPSISSLLLIFLS